jgi:hypothetical protein
LRVGQVTFCTSARTSCKNLNGLTFAIRYPTAIPAQFLRTRPAGGSFWGLGSSRKSVKRAANDDGYLLPVRDIVKRNKLYV